jgi:hypothetical protein
MLASEHYLSKLNKLQKNKRGHHKPILERQWRVDTQELGMSDHARE